MKTLSESDFGCEYHDERTIRHQPDLVKIMVSHRKIFFRTAEVCPACGAVERFRKGPDGTSVRKPNGDRLIYVRCAECGFPAIRWVRIPKSKANPTVTDNADNSPNGV